MPHYYDSAGRMVDAATATLPNGHCKPGYKEVLADGESFRASLRFMRDGVTADKPAPPASVSSQALRDAVRDARYLSSHDTTDAWPARAPQHAIDGATVRDSIRAARYR